MTLKLSMRSPLPRMYSNSPLPTTCTRTPDSFWTLKARLAKSTRVSRGASGESVAAESRMMLKLPTIEKVGPRSTCPPITRTCCAPVLYSTPPKVTD